LVTWVKAQMVVLIEYFKHRATRVVQLSLTKRDSYNNNNRFFKAFLSIPPKVSKGALKTLGAVA